MSRYRLSPVFLILTYSLVTSALAQVPPEVSNVAIDPASNLSWSVAAGADDYNVYSGRIGEFPDMPAECVGNEIVGTNFGIADDPDAGTALLFLVSGESDIDGEGTLGTGTGGSSRAAFGSCDGVADHALLNRIGFGWSEWSSDRLDLLGTQAYIDEQLAPETIDESSNNELNTRTSTWYPADDVYDPIYDRIDRAVYARRQLQEVLVKFWANHFNTDINKTIQYINSLDALDEDGAGTGRAHQDEDAGFRGLVLDGTFRDILEASALSVPMLIYLDGVTNISAAPNENYAREALELYSLGVAGGYTQQDVIELSRALTGWSVCKKTVPDENDPLAPCQNPLFPGLRWVSTFNAGLHDHTQKVLFAGTPQEVIFPDTSGNPSEGVNDLTIALDALADHPSTPDFIVRKLLTMLISEQPSQQMVDDAMTVWNNTSGDLREVTREVIAQGVDDPRFARQKIKDGFEHTISAYRGMRGLTDPTFCPDEPVLCSAHRLLSDAYFQGWQLMLYPIPTGHPEMGRDWIGTNGFLQRQNRTLAAATDIANYHSDVMGLVNDNNLQTADEIIDFFVDTLFGGAITPAERTALIEYLNTDDTGTPSPYDDDRVRNTVGLMLGMAQFMEQ